MSERRAEVRRVVDDGSERVSVMQKGDGETAVPLSTVGSSKPKVCSQLDSGGQLFPRSRLPTSHGVLNLLIGTAVFLDGEVMVEHTDLHAH